MSRIGKLPVTIPENVTAIYEDRILKVKGPKGELSVPIGRGITVSVENGIVTLARKNETKSQKALHGTMRNLVNNAVKGVCDGYSKTLELVGIGYRARLDGQDLNISLGFSHPVIFKAVDGIRFTVNDQIKIVVSGIDKQLVGQIAANIRHLRPPEPYKGKGVRYENEVIIKKAGKTSKGE